MTLNEEDTYKIQPSPLHLHPTPPVALTQDGQPRPSPAQVAAEMRRQELFVPLVQPELQEPVPPVEGADEAEKKAYEKKKRELEEKKKAHTLVQWVDFQFADAEDPKIMKIHVIFLHRTSS